MYQDRLFRLETDTGFFNTIIEGDDDHIDIIVIDKKSILDTINQIE